MSSVTRDQRHLRSHRCPVCDGAEQDPRGQAKRCSGFTTISNDGRKWVRCSRPEHAGALDPDDQGLYRHVFGGWCKCGVEHEARGPRGESSPDAVYDYRDEHGTLLFQVIRMPGKKFWQRAPSGEYSTSAIRRVLYRLPELRAAPDATVYVVEGEKDVETLRKHGFTATCNPMGAGKWHLCDSSPLNGREVLILPDNDEEGLRHAKAVQKSLPKSRIVKLPELLSGQKIKDVTNYLEAGGSMDELGKAPVIQIDDRRPPDNPDWWLAMDFRMDRQGNQILKPTTSNFAIAFSQHPAWRNVLAYDPLSERVRSLKVPPWKPHRMPKDAKPGFWQDTDTTAAQCWLSDEFHIDPPIMAVHNAIHLAARLRPYHPVREFLNSLKWDRTTRCNKWLVDYMGAEDTTYNRTVGQSWLVAAVARAMTPGCKCDTVLVLEGPPGTFKSSALRALAGNEWFAELNMRDAGAKDAMQQIQGKWIIEITEIDGTSYQDQSSMKSYCSRQVDTYRPSYGRETRDYPRQCVFAATTNKNQWISDDTGAVGRRMWPVSVTKCRVDALRHDRLQLWAEAVSRYEDGEEWHVTDPDLLTTMISEQDKRYQTDPWEEPISDYLTQPREQAGVTIEDILTMALKIEVERWTKRESNRVGDILRRAGWFGRVEWRNGKSRRVFRKNSPPDAPHEIIPEFVDYVEPDEERDGNERRGK